MYRKSNAHPAKLCYAGHVLMENRNGLVVDSVVTQATGRSEREAAIEMLTRIPGARLTLGADKAYDTKGFVADLRALWVIPHVAQNITRKGGSAIDARTSRHPRLRGQPGHTQTHRGGLRLGKDRRTDT